MTEESVGNRRMAWLVHADRRRDYSAAEQFGDVREVFSSISRDYDPRVAIQHARRVLSGFKEGDYLVMAGDPALCSICVAIVVESYGRCDILRWDKNRLTYNPMTLNFD
jgi:hypothetical protein